MKYLLLSALSAFVIGCNNDPEIKHHTVYQDSTLKVEKYFGDFKKRNYWVHIAPNGEVFLDSASYVPLKDDTITSPYPYKHQE